MLLKICLSSGALSFEKFNQAEKRKNNIYLLKTTTFSCIPFIKIVFFIITYRKKFF